MKPDSLTFGEWEPKLAECFFTLPRLDISMSRVSVTMNKPVNDRKTLMARGIIAMMLMASLLQILAPLPTDERAEFEPPEIEPQIVTAMATPSASSPGDLSKGGYHLKTGDWWEGKLDYVPSVNDPDADGVDNNQDSHPWNRNLGSSVKDCSSGCEGGLPTFHSMNSVNLLRQHTLQMLVVDII